MPSSLPSTQQALLAIPFSWNKVPLPPTLLASPWLELSRHAGFAQGVGLYGLPYISSTLGLHPAQIIFSLKLCVSICLLSVSLY